MEKEKQIKKELQKLTELFKDMKEDQKRLTRPILERAAFMAVNLSELENDINENGCTELFVNGSQKMIREAPATKVYNALIKNYMAVIKQLLELLPEKPEADELTAFLQGK